MLSQNNFGLSSRTHFGLLLSLSLLSAKLFQIFANTALFWSNQYRHNQVHSFRYLTIQNIVLVFWVIYFLVMCSPFIQPLWLSNYILKWRGLFEIFCCLRQIRIFIFKKFCLVTWSVSLKGINSSVKTNCKQYVIFWILVIIAMFIKTGTFEHGYFLMVMPKIVSEF